MSARVFLTCWLIYTAFWTPYIVREHFPAAALSERGSLNVQSYLGWSDDIFVGPHGGAYINNNPGASIAGAIPLIVLRPLLGAIERWNEKRPPANLRDTSDPILVLAVATRREFYLLAIGFLTVALVMAPATAGVLAYLCSRLREAGVPARPAALAALLCGLATPLFYRAAYLNHNLLEADAGFAALLVLWDPKRKRREAVTAALAGGLAGYALLCDYSGVVVLLAVGAYVLARGRSWKSLAAFAAGAAPMICALLLYQTWAFGSFYRPSQHFMTPTSPTSHGYRGIDWPSARLMWANFFHPRFGLFVYCPALLLAFAAPFIKHVRFRIPRLETAFLFGYFALFILFCAANQYSWLQPLTGFRYLVPVVPGLALLAIQTSQALAPSVRWLVAGAALIETFIFAAGHEKSLTSSLHALLAHRFELPWMVRLSEVGVKIPEGAPIIFAAMLAIGLAAVWIPVVRERRADRRRAATTVTVVTLLLVGLAQWGCRGSERITFQARVSDLRRPANSYATGKRPADIVQIAVPGKLLQPPLLVRPLLRRQADWSTPERAVASIVSANAAGDGTWMIESFAPAERERARLQLSDPMFFERTRDYYRHLGTVRITGEAEVRGFMVMLLLGQDEDGDATSLITTLAKTTEGWRQTNALAADDEFDLISTAVYTNGLG